MSPSRRTPPAREVEAVADRLHSAALHLLRRLRVEDDALGISPPRLSALSVVVFGGPVGIGALAAAEGVAAPTMSRLVDGLEREGLVRREPDPTDARGVLVRATADGTTDASAWAGVAVWRRSRRVCGSCPRTSSPRSRGAPS